MTDRRLGETAGAVMAGILFALLGCAEPGGRERIATVYSCDNPKITSSGGAGCFPPGDPKYMAIALRARPASMAEEPARLREPGAGLQGRILDERKQQGTVWYQVEIDGKVGWIAEHLVIGANPAPISEP